MGPTWLTETEFGPCKPLSGAGPDNAVAVLLPAISADDEPEDTINDAWVYMGGLRSLGSYQLGAFTIGLGAALTVLEQRPQSRGENTGVGVIDLGLDVRRALDMQLRGQPLELSVFAIASHYYNDLDLLSIRDDDFHIKRTYEIGLTMGTAKPLRLLGMDWQRVGMGYM